MTCNNLKMYLDDFFHMLELYDAYKDILKAYIDLFLENDSYYNALSIYEIFFMIYDISANDESKRKHSFYGLSPIEIFSMKHQNSENDKSDKNPYIQNEPNIPLNFAKLMIKYGENSDIASLKDIPIHSVNVFLLGLAVYSQNRNYRRSFEEYVESSGYEKFYKTVDGKFSHEEFLYRWGIASLFHDIARPIEHMSKPLKILLNKDINSIFNNQVEDMGIDFINLQKLNSITKIDYNFTEDYNEKNPITKFLNLFKSTNILTFKIAHNFRLDIRQLNFLRDSLNENYIIGDCPSKGPIFTDSGLISALTILKLYGFLTQKFHKSPDSFFYPIVDSASAILLQNYYNKTLQKEPFSLKPMYVESHPIAFLLILCDELQQWKRQQFDVLDKYKYFVDDLEIEINDNMIAVQYPFKSVSQDFGFERDKKAFLYDVLDIQRTFLHGLIIDVSRDYGGDVEREVIRDRNILDIQTSDLLLRVTEMLAREDYKQLHGSMDGFDDLSPDKLLAYYRRAMSIPKKLDLIGCEVASQSDCREPIYEFLDKEIEDLTILEHKEWCEEKMGLGWTYAEYMDEENRKTPYLVEWYELSNETKQYYKDAIENIPYLLNSIGLKVVRSKIRLLTFEMHKYYLREKGMKFDKYATAKELFDELEYHIQYINYKQANSIVRILNERGYELVDKDDKVFALEEGYAGYKRNLIYKFDIRDIEYFAERLHEEWYKLKFNLGWKYGGNHDIVLKTSPNLVSWDMLNSKIQEDNKWTFKYLPEMCNESHIGLFIVKKY